MTKNWNSPRRLTLKMIRQIGKPFGIEIEETGQKKYPYEIWNKSNHSVTGLCETLDEVWGEFTSFGYNPN